MATQTTLLNGVGNDISPTIQTYYDKKLQDRLISNFVHFQFGQKRPIPKMGGNQINFRKFTSLTPTTSALTEGTTPNGSSINITQITAKPAQYGNFVEVSDVLDMVAIDPVLDEMADVLGEQAAESLDVITRNTLITGTNLQYANNKASAATLAATDYLNVDEIRKAIRTLKNGKAKPLADGYYVAIVHPNAVYDLQGDDAWVNASQYAGSTQIFQGEIGKLYGVRFVESPNAYSLANGAVGSPGTKTLYSTIVVGANAFGVVDIAGSSAVQNIIKPHGSAGTADPLNQRATTGWKAMFTAVILEQAAMVQIRHVASV